MWVILLMQGAVWHGSRYFVRLISRVAGSYMLRICIFVLYSAFIWISGVYKNRNYFYYLCLQTGEAGAAGRALRPQGRDARGVAEREPAPRVAGQLRLRHGRRRGRDQEARGDRDGHQLVRGARPGGRVGRHGAGAGELPRHRQNQFEVSGGCFVFLYPSHVKK